MDTVFRNVTFFVAGLGLFAGLADGQWIEFNDPDSSAKCGLVNAANAAFIVREDTLQLEKVNGTDTIFEDFVVDQDFNVLVNGELRGFINFETDDRGLRTIWWVTLVSNNAVELDEFDAEVQDSGQAPDDLDAYGCNPESYLDDGGGNDNANDNSGGGGPIISFCGQGMLATVIPLMLAGGLLRFRPARHRPRRCGTAIELANGSPRVPKKLDIIEHWD
jgi:hypothetical protein